MPDYQEGMLVFQSLSAKGGLVQVIQDATDSLITHVGILHKNENGEWVVIESIGNNGKETPIDTFLTRSNDIVWYKKISGVSGDKASRFVREAIRLAKKYPEYDTEFEYGNNKLYCSELVAMAAKAVGIDLFDTDVRTSWLDRNDESVVRYLGFSPHPANLEKWRILPPHTLFYSNKLEDSSNSTQNTPKGPVPSHALYDTLPGKTTEDKMAYLEQIWGKNVDRVVTEREIIDGHTHYLFKVSIGGVEYGLIFFGQFPEEEILAQKILKKVNYPVRRAE